MKQINSRYAGVALALAACLVGAGCTRGPGPQAVPTPTPARPAPTGPPSALADGSAPGPVPMDVAPAAGPPVIGAMAINTNHPLVRRCRDEHAISGAFLVGHIGVFGASVTFEADPGDDAASGRALTACDFVPDGGDLALGGHGYARWDEEQQLAVSGGGLNVVSDGRTDIGFVSVPAPEGATWLAHDLGDHRIVYPVVDGHPVRIAGPLGPEEQENYASSVRFLADDGTVIEDREVRGTIAG